MFTVVYKSHTPFSSQFLPFLSEWRPGPQINFLTYSAYFPAIQHESHEVHHILHYLSKQQSGAEILKIAEASGIKKCQNSCFPAGIKKTWVAWWRHQVLHHAAESQES